MALPAQLVGRYHVTPTTPTGQTKGYYTVIPVGTTDLLTLGTVHEHRHLVSEGRIAGTGSLVARYHVLERRTVTITLSPVQDAFVWDKEPTINYGNSHDIAVGRAGAFLARGLVQFDVSSLRTDLLIISASLRLRCRFLGSGEIGVHPLLAAWDEYGVTWANQPPVTPNPVATGSTPSQVGETVDLDITDLFLGWYRRTRANYGVGIRATNEATMLATLFGAREAGPDWQPQLVVTYYEPDARGDASDLPSSGHVAVHEERLITSLGAVSDEPEGTFKRDPCSGGPTLVWQGPAHELVNSPYAPPGASALVEEALRPLVLRGPGEWAWSIYRHTDSYLGHPFYTLLTAAGPGPTSLPYGGMATSKYVYSFQAFRLWWGNSPQQSPFLGMPSTFTHWLGDVTPYGLRPYTAYTWYVHAYVYVRRDALPCFLPARGRVSKPSLFSQGVARAVSDLPAAGYAMGLQAASLMSQGAPSRPDTPSFGIPRFAGVSALMSGGIPRVASQSDLSAMGTAELGPNSMATEGTVPLANDLPSEGDVGTAPNQLLHQGFVRAPVASDLPSHGQPNSPWLRARGAARQYVHLTGVGRVRETSNLPSMGIMANRGASDLPVSGWTRVQAVSELLSSAIARGGRSDMPSTGAVDARVIELHIDLSAWPPEGRSPFPG